MKRFIFFFLEPFVGGLLFPMGFLLKGLPSFFLAPIIGFILLSYRMSFFREEKRLRDDLWRLLFFSFGVWLLGYAWIPYTLFEFGAIVPPFNYLLALLAIVVILPQVFFLPLFTAIKRKLPQGLPWGLLFAGFCVGLEEFFPQLFPSHVGQAWLNLAPHIGLAPYFGASIFSLFSFWLIYEVARVINEKKFSWAFLACFTLFLSLNFAFPLSFKKEGAPQLHLRLVQANIGNYIKVASEQGNANAINDVLKSYVDLSLVPSKEKLDLLLWPETAYPYTLETRSWKEYAPHLPPLLVDLAKKNQADFFWGGYEWANSFSSSDFETTYNAAFHFSYSDQGTVEARDVYRKIKLLPFGETLPFGPFNTFFGKLITNISYFKKGESYPLFQTKKGGRFISLICYEALFSSFVRDYLNRLSSSPHFIVNLTNDSWYGDSSEPYEHLFLSKWRAVEFNIPFVRMTNTGISVVVYPDGTESPRLGVGEKDILDVSLPLVERGPSFYERHGLWGTFILWLGLVFLFTGRFLWRSLRARGHGDV